MIADVKYLIENIIPLLNVAAREKRLANCGLSGNSLERSSENRKRLGIGTWEERHIFAEKRSHPHF